MCCPHTHVCMYVCTCQDECTYVYIVQYYIPPTSLYALCYLHCYNILVMSIQLQLLPHSLQHSSHHWRSVETPAPPQHLPAALVRDLEQRDITEEDYDLLLQLDRCVSYGVQCVYMLCINMQGYTIFCVRTYVVRYVRTFYATVCQSTQYVHIMNIYTYVYTLHVST